MKRKAVTTGKSGSSKVTKGTKNAAPAGPPPAPPQKIRLVQGGEPATKTTKPGTRATTPAMSKKSDAGMPAAKKKSR
jgi:hypothetical protein